MRIFPEQVLKEYIAVRPEVKTALQEWVGQLRHSSVLDQLVVVIKFTIKFVYIRFIGTHTEYNKIDLFDYLKLKTLKIL